MVSFRKETGISIEYFLALLSFELDSTVVDFEGTFSSKSEGVTIASCIASF